MLSSTQPHGTVQIPASEVGTGMLIVTFHLLILIDYTYILLG